MSSFLQAFSAALSGWKVEPIGENNLEDALQVMESNVSGYYAVTGEAFPDIKNIREDITALPPGRTLADKNFLLLFYQRRPAAVIDYVEGYPDETTGYIGLFMLHADIHRRGLGIQLMKALEICAAETGKNRIELGCYQTNETGKGFWKSMGFRELRRCKREGADGISRTLLVLEKEIQ